MKALRNICIVMALVLSHAMCATVAFAYSQLWCGGKHMGYSAPPRAAFWLAVPYAAGILLFAGLAWLMHRKNKKDV